MNADPFRDLPTEQQYRDDLARGWPDMAQMDDDDGMRAPWWRMAVLALLPFTALFAWVAVVALVVAWVIAARIG